MSYNFSLTRKLKWKEMKRKSGMSYKDGSPKMTILLSRSHLMLF